MGRAFEYRKARKFARWNKMAVQFTRIGKEIAMAVKSGGPFPENNPRLRIAMQNARAANMPKANVEAAIKRATSKDEKDYQEVVYEGYGPYGVAIIVETATDNPTRTVANVRHYFSKYGGALGTSGSVDYMFERKAFFKIDAPEQDLEELELSLIDFGLEELVRDEEETIVQTTFTDFGKMQTALEEQNISVVSTDIERIPMNYVAVSEAQREELDKIIEKLEEDEDVQAVFHNMQDGDGA
ncbi:MAG: YebC/PmpR family DNA-binding transcriptional regulator [Chitinophagales bacterium]|nr:YebC/PmpR family DNA-binding transcriptional regulator [Bacteroidota bacterium]MCB9042888.1 YebC/PmpR family DNA-binding transcriptional regulator [Chitinophagales bacterium]